jgi:hypothetical protein
MGPARPRTDAVFEDAARRLKSRRECSRRHAAAAVRGARRRAARDHGARGRANPVARVALAPRQLSREMVAMIEAGLAVIAERYDAARTWRDRAARRSRCFRRTSTSCSRRAPSARRRRDTGDRRPAVQPDVDAAAHAVRPSAVGAGAAGIAGRASDRWDPIGGGSLHALGRGLDPREAPAKLNTPTRRPGRAIDEHNGSGMPSTRLLQPPSCRRRPPVAILMELAHARSPRRKEACAGWHSPTSTGRDAISWFAGPARGERECGNRRAGNDLQGHRAAAAMARRRMVADWKPCRYAAVRRQVRRQ